MMQNKLVTIFGGTGFLGRHAVRVLAKAGWRIKVASRHPASGFFLRPLGTVGQIDFVKCDIADREQVAAALAGSDAVVNLCGILFQRGQSFDDVQAQGAGNVAEAAAAAGVRALVHVSAIGADKDSEAVYAQTKADGERRMREAFPAATILRPGTITAEQIAAVIGPVSVSHDDPAAPKSPGQLASHYAPSLPLRLNAARADEGEALLGFGPGPATLNLSPAGDLVEAAANLFAMLRALDEPSRFRAIAVMPIPAAGIGIAINDRLARAAAPKL